MLETQLVMHEEDHEKILDVIQRLVRGANAKGIFVVDKNGHLMAEAGEMQNVDSTSLASLTAGCIAATGGLAKIVGEEEFPIHFHQGQRDNLHMTVVASRIILVVVFDDRSSPSASPSSSPGGCQVIANPLNDRVSLAGRSSKYEDS